MQTVQISDKAASQLAKMAEGEHVPASEIMERLIQARADELSRKRRLHEFFSQYQRDLSGFRFDREEANAR
jgi:predicted CopG family antitoxin